MDSNFIYAKFLSGYAAQGKKILLESSSELRLLQLKSSKWNLSANDQFFRLSFSVALRDRFKLLEYLERYSELGHAWDLHLSVEQRSFAILRPICSSPSANSLSFEFTLENLQLKSPAKL
jgi:hypothetical protein